MLGVGAIVGSLVSAVVLEYSTPFVVYLLCAVVTFLISIAGAYTGDYLETNKYALA